MTDWEPGDGSTWTWDPKEHLWFGGWSDHVGTLTPAEMDAAYPNHPWVEEGPSGPSAQPSESDRK